MSSTFGWNTAKGSGGKLAIPLEPGSDNDLVALRLQVRLSNDGTLGYRFYEEWDGQQDAWMCLCLDRHRNLVGQTIAHRKKDARRLMQDVFDAKQLGKTGLTF